jgi:hypothetical protein
MQDAGQRSVVPQAPRMREEAQSRQRLRDRVLAKREALRAASPIPPAPANGPPLPAPPAASATLAALAEEMHETGRAASDDIRVPIAAEMAPAGEPRGATTDRQSVRNKQTVRPTNDRPTDRLAQVRITANSDVASGHAPPAEQKSSSAPVARSLTHFSFHTLH